MASTSVTTVSSSSNVTFEFFRTFFKHRFIDFTNRSKNPPHQGAFSRLKDHSIFLEDRYPFTSGRSKRADSFFAAEMKVFALSDMTFAGTPLLAVNLLNLLRNASVVISWTSSRWTARVTPHVYRHIHTFAISVLILSSFCTYNGPAKSIPVHANGGSSVTLDFGKGGGSGGLYDFPSKRRQIAQLCIIFLTNCLPFTTQKFDLSSECFFHAIVLDLFVAFFYDELCCSVISIEHHWVFRLVPNVNIRYTSSAS